MPLPLPPRVCVGPLHRCLHRPFPSEQAALKSLYLTTRSLDPKGTGQQRWMVRWKPVLNVLAITFADRMPTSDTL